MRSRSVRLLALGAALALVPAIPVIAGDPSVPIPSLWIVDDVVQDTADLTLAGDLTTSFDTPRSAFSSVAVDPLDGTLWGANEAANGGLGKLVNYDTDGTPLREIPAGDFGAFSLEGVAVATDGSLWVVDDPDDGNGTPDSIHHVDRGGSAIVDGVFPLPVAGFPLSPDSPQDIAYDPFDDTLWITDNGAEAVYNVGLDGQVIRYFSTTSPVFQEALASEDGITNPEDGITNPQGITVEADGVLWLTSRGTGHLLRLSITGPDAAPVIAVTDVLDARTALPGANNPTGIAYTSTTTAPSTRAAVGLLHEELVKASPELGRKSAKWLDQAINQLESALTTDALWTEDGEPADAVGIEDDSLSSMKNAVRFLERIRGDAPTVDAVSASLVDLVRGAAVDQIERAKGLPTDPALVAEAEAKIVSGDAEERLERAANDYKAAWETATLAITQFFALPGGSLWVLDGDLRTSANITPTGAPNFAVPTPNTAISSIVVDPIDGTLWGANESSGGVGKLVHYALDGTVLGEISANVFGAEGVEGVAVAPDGTLWVVDDPDAGGDSVYHLERDGTLRSSFPTSAFSSSDLGTATSPQDIAYDPYDGTLWITDNGANAVFHVTTDGTLLGGFKTTGGVFEATAGNLTNPQGITVESPYHLWITDRSAGQLVRVDKSGSYVLQVLPATVVAPTADDPTGIAYIPTVPTEPVVEVAALEPASTEAATDDATQSAATSEVVVEEPAAEEPPAEEPAAEEPAAEEPAAEEPAAEEPAAEEPAAEEPAAEEPPAEEPAAEEPPAEEPPAEEPPAEEPAAEEPVGTTEGGTP